MKKENSIFISIASYRDSELIPTIQDCIKNSSKKYHIIFGICIQDTIENLNSFPFKGPKFKVSKVNYTKSKGCSWARNLIQKKLYSNEKYFMQIDSHTRFIKNWDIEIIEMLRKCPSKKPIISTFPNCYLLNDHKKEYLNYKIPHRIVIKNFDDNGFTFNVIACELNYKLIRSLWCAGGFIFTYGNWNNEVIYNPKLYFRGGEEDITIKSYTHGWDIFCPNKSIIFHLYQSNYEESKSSKDVKIHHWNDHVDFECNYNLLNGLYNGKNVGKVRTIKEFEKNFGIDFKNKKVHKNAQKGLYIQDFNNQINS